MAQAIVTKFFGATDTKDARIQVKSWLGTKYYGYCDSTNNPHTFAFEQWLAETNKRLGCNYNLTSGRAASMPDESGYCFIIE